MAELTGGAQVASCAAYVAAPASAPARKPAGRTFAQAAALADTAEALGHHGAGHARGKTVITV